MIARKLAKNDGPEGIQSCQGVFDRLLCALRDQKALSISGASGVSHALAKLTIAVRCGMAEEIASARNAAEQELIRRSS